jgi:hypothetical protein
MTFCVLGTHYVGIYVCAIYQVQTYIFLALVLFKVRINYSYSCPSFVNLKGSIIQQHFALQATIFMMNEEIACKMVFFFHQKKHSYLILSFSLSFFKMHRAATAGSFSLKNI